ncbi:MAG: hypothetical protein JHC35_05585 [Sulfuricurvum sp.]|jgi:O-antigen/teichoic acid export membrane protein|uniref:lipopolysaccharide biosynthesis protein n=1 Tax=Sulfuricurvum sp. TaxID=2025608 RepID=UPI0025E34193|nr:hypothetical protein [Sulfuricurvum sp.]MCI4406748.1 hypothetical protein [Sulfuricurvum sp.]
MKLLHKALSSIVAFRERQGFWIFGSILIERLGSFLLTAVMARTLSPMGFGQLSSIRTALGVVQPLAGGGAQHALLRYGVLLPTDDERRILTLGAIAFGSFFSIIPIIGLILWYLYFSPSFSDEGEYSFWIIVFSLASYNLFEIVRNYCRIVSDNKRFVFLGMTYTVLLIILGWLVSRWGIVGFASLFALIPLLLGLSAIPQLLIHHRNIVMPKRDFWYYGFHVGSGAMVNQLFFSLDILLLTATGTDSSLIAAYKIATIIPYSLFILPGSFLSADLLHLTRHSHDRSALMEYIRSYFSIFALLTPILIAMLWFLSEPLIEWCFGNNYPLSASLQNIFLVGLAGTFLLRIPFGNILQAVGKANWNVWHAVLLIPLSAIAMHQAIETHGVIGAAWVTSITFLISGIISLLLFGLYLRTLAKSNHQ